MSDSQTQTQNGTGRCETFEVFDYVFSFLMEFADKAETVAPQPKRRGVADDGTADEVHEEEEKPLENGGDGNAGELFRKLPAGDKEELLKDVFAKIVGNLLAKLPDDGKEAFLARCFHGLLPKLSGESRREVEIELKDLSSQSQEAFAMPSAPQLRPAIPVDHRKLFCSVKLVKVKYPRTIANPQLEPGPRPQPPPPQPPPSPTTT